MGKKVIYKDGDQVGVLLFVKESTKGRHRRAIFKCHCGGEFSAQVDNVVAGKTKSCGCDKATITVMGHKVHTPEYNTWNSMINRCYNPDSDQYHNYGLRGISVYPEWRNSFKSFLSHVGRKPSSNMSLDRIDVNGNYEPGNVRWATQKEQCRNTRSNTLIIFSGMTKCLSEWSEITKISRYTLHNRLFKYEWPVEKSLTLTPVKGRNQWRQ